MSDTFVVTLTLLVAQAVRFGWDPNAPVSGPSAPPYWFVSIAIAALWLVNLTLMRSREPRILGHGGQEFQRVLSASWYTFAIIAIIGFLTQWQISRGYLLFALPLGTVALCIYRAAWRAWIHAQRDAGELQAQVLVAGPFRTSEQMIRRLRRAPRAGYNVIGVCLPARRRDGLADDLADIPILGDIDDAVTQAQRVGAEYILLSGNDDVSLAEARRLGWGLEGTGIGLIVAPAMVDIAGPRVMMSPVEGLPLMHVDPAEFTGGKYLAKSIADRVTSALLLLFAGLPMLVIAALIRLTSSGPVLFRQERIGRNGELFRMLKFRSMYVDAEARLADLRPASDGNDVLFKMKDDPRVTAVGKFLRRFSIDELPQLLNVFKGDMSLVGPRPPLPSEAEAWDDRVFRRQLVKPGMTGLWQVSGRSDLSWDESVRLDLYYTENWSLGGDFLIMLRTVAAVLGRRGAY
ncbi:sugar transferase [Demequina sp.]|uniref:sugar transferase n=1 Tax=Demequina sp. TaxID=2050685 RepID=UPI003D1119BB